MKKKIFALLTVWTVVFGLVGAGAAQTTDNKKTRANNQLLELLPPSDAALTVDTKRLSAEALPQILSANQPMLNEILGKLEEIKTRTGVDYKQFQQVVAGVSSIRAVENGYDYEPVVLARGQFNAAILIAAAKTAANGKFREEKIGARTVLVFSPRSTVEQTGGTLEQKKEQIVNSKIGSFLSKFLVGLNKEMALTTYDNNTLVFGSLARVRETFESKTRISTEVLALASRKPNAIVGFGALLPNGLAQFIDLLDDDTVGNSFAGIRQLSGSMDVAGENSTVSVAVRTVEPAQAKNLKDTIAGLQGFAGILKGSQRADQKAYGRMLESVKIEQTGNLVTLDLQIPQTDINVLVGEKK